MRDDAIIELLFSRDEGAIRELETSYGAKLCALSLRILHNAEDAQECVNETYWKLWNAVPPERPDYLFAYLAQICRNLSLNRLAMGQASRRKAEIVELTQEMQMCIPDVSQQRTMESGELHRKLDSFLESLPAESRILFLRRYWYSESVTEIAQRYGLRENTVSARLHRIRKKLKIYLHQEGLL